jgi:hypothetical protein
VLVILRGDTSSPKAPQRHDPTVIEVEESKDRSLLAPENAVLLRPKNEDALRDEQTKSLECEVDRFVMELHIAREAMKLHLLRAWHRASDGDCCRHLTATGLPGAGLAPIGACLRAM